MTTTLRQLEAACAARDVEALSRLVSTGELVTLPSTENHTAIQALSSLPTEQSSLVDSSIRAKTLFQRARAYRQLGKLELAVSDLRTATSVDPHLGETFVELSITLRLQGNLDEAKQVTDHALELDPSLAHCIIQLQSTTIDSQRREGMRLTEVVRSLNVQLRALEREQSVQNIFVDVSGAVLNVPLRDSDTVGHLKASIAQQRATPISHLRVIHSGRELRNDWEPVSAFSLHNETKLFVVVSPSPTSSTTTPAKPLAAAAASSLARETSSTVPGSSQHEAEIQRLQRELSLAQEEKQRLQRALAESTAAAAAAGDDGARQRSSTGTSPLPRIIQHYIARTRQQLHEHRMLLNMCKNVQAFEISRSVGYAQNGLAARIRCVVPGFPWPQREYTLKVCFNFDQDTLAARGTYINEYLELSRLPAHSNVVRMVCEFFDEVRDHVREFLPDFVRDQSLVIARDGTRRNRKTQYYVLESLPMTLAAYLMQYYPLPARVPNALLATVLVHIGLALQHLEQHLLAHRDLKLENILLEFDDDDDNDDNDHSGNTAGAGTGNDRGEGHRAAPPRILRCVLSEFGASCRLNSERKSIAAVSDIGSLLTPNWGNGAHIAPELHAQVISALQRRSAAHVVVDYSQQPAFELGVLAYEIVNGDGPVQGYPQRDRRTGTINYDDSTIENLIGVPQRVVELLRRAVSSEPEQRPAVREIIEAVVATMDEEGALAACVH